MKYKTIEVRSIFAPRWWQLRYRYKWWKLQRASRNRTPLQRHIDEEMDRAFLFGDGDPR